MVNEKGNQGRGAWTYQKGTDNTPQPPEHSAEPQNAAASAHKSAAAAGVAAPAKAPRAAAKKPRAARGGSAWAKNRMREITRSPGRYLAIFAIIALGVGFFSGLKVTRPSMLKTGNDYVNTQHLYDYRLVSTLGMVEEDVPALAAVDGVANADVAVSVDIAVTMAGKPGTEDNTYNLRAHSLMDGINVPGVTAGRLPTAANECLLDAELFSASAVGKTIKIKPSNTQDARDMFQYSEYTVVGVGTSPAYLNVERGTTELPGGALDAFVYIPKAGFDTDVYTEAYVTLDETGEIFSDEYEEAAERMEQPVKQALRTRADIRYDDIMTEANEELADAEEEYNDGMAEYQSEKADAEQELADAWAELEDARVQIADGEQELKDGEKELEDAQAALDAGLAGYSSGEQQYLSGKAAADAQFAAAQAEIDNNRATLQAALDQLAQVPGGTESPQYAEAAAGMAALDAAQAELNNQKAATAAQMDAASAQLGAANNQLATAAEQIAEGRAEIADGWAELNDAKAQYADGLAEYEDGKREAEEEFAKAEKELADARQKIDDAKQDVADIEPADCYAFGRGLNSGYSSFESDSKIVDGVAKVFPIFFFLVAALVCTTTMTRMVEEQRTQIGTLKALGYKNSSVLWKYVSYSGSAALLGTLFGYFGGCVLFPWAIWKAYGMLYGFAPIERVFDWRVLAISLAAALLCSAGATFAACKAELAQQPAELMRPKAPKAGKRIFLEYIPLIWKRMGFLQKVSLRNIFRYKKRLFMMLLGISGCTALMLAGLGLRDSVAGVADYQYDTIMKYDYTLMFSKGKNEEAREAFKEETADLLSDCVFVATDSFDVICGPVSKQASVIITSDPEITKLVDLHLYDQSVPWPAEGSVVLSEKLAQQAGVEVGDTIEMKTSDTRTDTFTVGGICENYVFNYVYMSAETYEKVAGGTVTYDSAFATSAGGDVHANAATLMSDHGVAGVQAVADTRVSVANMMKSLDSIILLVVSCAAALAFVVLFNLSNINITERVREIATIKVLGFYPGEVGSYVFRENLVLTAMGALLGLPLGIVLHRFIMTQINVDFINFRMHISLASFAIAFAATFVFTLLVDLTMRRKLDRINMAESLKSVE